MLFHLAIVDDAREKVSRCSYWNAFIGIPFDARDREHVKNDFGSSVCSYFDGEKSKMKYEKPRKKRRIFHFFGFGAFAARAVSRPNNKLQGNFFNQSS